MTPICQAPSARVPPAWTGGTPATVGRGTPMCRGVCAMVGGVRWRGMKLLSHEARQWEDKGQHQVKREEIRMQPAEQWPVTGTMDVYEAVRSRRAVRAFTDRPVPREVLERVLAAAAWAPSGSNIQPWHVYVLTGAPL